jgi:fatty acid desaturase
MESGNIFIGISHAVFAMFAAVVKWLNLKDKRQQTLKKLIAEASGALLSAGMVYLLCYLAWGWDAPYCIGLAGATGFAGGKGAGKLCDMIDKQATGKMSGDN